MANIKSQIKRNRQALERRQRNKAVRSTVKTYERRFREALESGDTTRAEEAYRAAARHLDKAASKNVIHANTAANHKSRMAKKLGTLPQS